MARKTPVKSSGPAVEVCAPDSMTATGIRKATSVAMPSSHHSVPLRYSWKFRHDIQRFAAHNFSWTRICIAPMPQRRRCSRYWSGVAGASPTASVWWW